TDLERLVVTNECMFNSKSKPLTTIETATLIRSFLGEDLSARQRNSITSKTIERYAKTACAPCLITSVVLLVRMPLTLFTATSNVLSRYNEGVIKFAQVDSKNHSAFYHMGYKDFHNARFLIAARTSYLKSPLHATSTIQSLAEGTITLPIAYEKLSNCDRPLHDYCRKKKLEVMQSDEQIANEIFPND
ncbi:hypothetical protein PFISCL1PPCAC_9704, partial [Pristionchus fissidentatus]